MREDQGKPDARRAFERVKAENQMLKKELDELRDSNITTENRYQDLVDSTINARLLEELRAHGVELEKPEYVQFFRQKLVAFPGG